MKVTFYPHQLESIDRMKNLEKTGVVNVDSWVIETSLGYLSDPMGSGKTLTVAGLIRDNSMEWDLTQPFRVRRYSAPADPRNLVSVYKVEVYERVDATLVVANPSIINHWEEELSKLDLRVQKVMTKRDVDFSPVFNDSSETVACDVVLICSTVYNSFASRCEMTYKAWKRVVFDEPHERSHVLLPITFGFCWIVSANMSDVFLGVRSGFLHDIFCRFSQDVMQKIVVRNSPEMIRQSFQLPPVLKKYYECYQPILNTVKGIVSDKVAQMISAGNMRGAVSELGGEITDNIAELVKAKKLSELQFVQDEATVERILKQINELDSKFADALSGPCLICCKPLINPVMETCCQNIFCSECVLSIFKTKDGRNVSCPICRVPIPDLKSLVFINPSRQHDPVERQTLQPTKQQQLIDIITADQTCGKKFIVYSSWDETFLTIKNVFEENKIEYSEVKGNIASRIKILENFRSGKIKVLFLNSNYSGSGLNLQEATDLIFYHSTPNECFIIGRANRIGRTIPLVCHILN